MKNRALIAAVVMVAAIAGSAQETIVKWSTRGPTHSLRPGATFTCDLFATIQDGWHIYSMTQPSGGPVRTVFSVPDKQAFKLSGLVQGPMPHIAYDPNFEINTETHEGKVRFRVPLSIAPTAQAGKDKVLLEVTFQACNDSTCLPAKKVSLTAPVEVGATAETPPRPRSEISSSASATTNLSSGAAGFAATPIVKTGLPASPPLNANLSTLPFGTFVSLAAVMGALSLLTPCVFPMLPITVSYFASHSCGRRSSAVYTAAVYATGIILTFTALGMLLAVLFGAGGVNQLAANPWINLLVAAIFIGFAFSLFGAFFVQVPTSVMNTVSSLSRSGEANQMLGALLMGLTFTLTSFTCTSPFVGSLLVLTAEGNWRWPLVGMLTFSTVFALPFFVFALAPQLISQLPKAGGWLNSIKVVMGFLEVAAAMKFLSNADLVWHWGIFTRHVVLAVWIGIGTLSVLYVLGYLRMPHDSPSESVGAARLTVALILLTVTIWLVPGLFGGQLGELESFLPPESGRTEMLHGVRPAEFAGLHGDLDWITNDYERAIASARQENKLVFIDFTGYTCTNCRWMEANIFPRPEIAREMDRFIRARLYTDGAGQLFERQQKLQQGKFGTVALPLYAIVRPDGSIVATFPGLTRNPHEFLLFLKRGV